MQENILSTGKRLLSFTYVHISVFSDPSHPFLELTNLALSKLNEKERSEVNVIKVSNDGSIVSCLSYPSFFSQGFPELKQSWRIHIPSGMVVYRTYQESLNPPILHRKELLLAKEHQDQERFQKLTQSAEAIGLFDDPSRIGFKQQWEKMIFEKGYRLEGEQFIPLGNVEDIEILEDQSEEEIRIARQRTALSRNNFSAPIQSLMRFGYLDGSYSIFDYGCGKGDDLRGLRENQINASGWDPYYDPDEERVEADLVNLGFVINVIEDYQERVDALQGAYSLTKRLLVVGVMLNKPKISGKSFRDGVLTGRNTFQKYYTPEELNHFIEKHLHENVIPIAPGVVFVFKDKELEQRFLLERNRAHRSILRISRVERSKPVRVKRNRKQEKFDAHQEVLDKLWLFWLQLGRKPKKEEVEDYEYLKSHFQTLGKALNFLLEFHDPALLQKAYKIREEDLLVFLALELFKPRKTNSQRDLSLQNDLKHFFGTSTNALRLAKELLYKISDHDALREAALASQNQGLGWLENDALQLHSDLAEHLPPLLRVYIGCATQLIGDVNSADLVKIHLLTGKLSLMKYDNFFGKALPRMTERLKLNFHRQTVDFFDYSDPYIPPYLFNKSRFMNEEMEGYAEQQKFEEDLEKLNLFDISGYGPSPEYFDEKLEEARWQVKGRELMRSTRIPNLDQACGENFCFRDFIVCGETQQKTGIVNLPKEADTYNALHDLATQLLDPIIDYYGEINLTYGFASAELARNISGRIAPKLDQHAAHEKNRNGNYICSRLGAAVDFIVEDENMFEVAKWIIAEQLEFDRMYLYGTERPIHLSFGPERKKQVTLMKMAASTGRLIPKNISLDQLHRL